jgi:hypothetical protein
MVALGIDVQFIRPGRPTDHAIVERTHQTMARQALQGQSWADQEALWEALDERRGILNTEMPTRLFGGCTPVQAHPAASHSGRPYRPEWEEELLDVDRVYRYLAGCRWFRQVKPNGRIKIGGYQYYLGLRLAGAAVTITFDQEAGVLLCQPENKPIAVAVPIQGISASELMGELSTITRMPAYQLALPLSAAATRQQSYVACFTGTN